MTLSVCVLPKELLEILGSLLCAFKQLWIPTASFYSYNDLFYQGIRRYALAPWLVTTLSQARTQQEVSFSEQHLQTLKGRWMCLDTVGGKLRRNNVLFLQKRIAEAVTAKFIIHHSSIMNRNLARHGGTAAGSYQLRSAKFCLSGSSSINKW